MDMSKISETERPDALASLQKVIENRVNAFGVSEPTIYTGRSSGEYRLTVELAGVKDTEQAMNLIGKTAQLDFRELDSSGADFKKTDLTGSDLTSATVQFSQTTNEPEIAIQFNAEGATKFAAITARNIGKPVGIYLDDQLISYPTVNQEIVGGKAQITGQFTYTQAKDLAIQLDAGRLPMPITNIEQRTVDATLGRDSIRRSAVAGAIGILVVCLFMVIYYRFPGVLSSVGILLYAIFTIAFMKLFGITLTMGGVAGLLLTIGMSVETDVLIFERIREELRTGKNLQSSIRLGFKKTWPTLWDSNAVTLIIAALLYTVGGTVRGFALVMALGIFIGLFTTFVYTQALITFASSFKIFRKHWLYAVEKTEDVL